LFWFCRWRYNDMKKWFTNLPYFCSIFEYIFIWYIVAISINIDLMSNRNFKYHNPPLINLLKLTVKPTVRVQGISPFLFTFQLVAFNLASDPFLFDAPRRNCLDLLQWGCSSHPTSSDLALSGSSHTLALVRFWCRAGPPGPPEWTGPPAPWRGDFPQCLALSATLLLPHDAAIPFRLQPAGDRHHFTTWVGNGINRCVSYQNIRKWICEKYWSTVPKNQFWNFLS